MARRSKYDRNEEKALTVISTAVHALLATNTPAINVYSALRHSLALIIAAQEPKIADELIEMVRDQLSKDVADVLAVFGGEESTEIH